MKDNLVKRKVNVFISSKCDATYNIVRSALMALLDETGLVSDYVFEAEPASSKQLEAAYMDELEASHLVIFIIRNIDGVPDAVLREHNRARALNIRSLYFFCDENDGEVTELQKELIQKQIVKFKVVHEFSGVAKEAYIATITDIVNIYRSRYIESKPINNSSPDCTSVQPCAKDNYNIPETKTSSVSSNLLIYDVKEYSCMYPRTTSVIEEFLEPTNELQQPSCLLDEEVANILLRILGQTGEVKEETFENIIRELPSVCLPEFLPLVTARWQAVKSYFLSDIKRCRTQIEQVYNSIKNNPSIYGWIKADVLIDLRNQIIIENNLNNQLCPNEAQEELASLDFSAHYPIVDRLSKSVSKEVLDDFVDSQLKHPNVKVWGSSIPQVSDSIASSFIITALHGSLTHVLLVTEMLKSVLLAQCLKQEWHQQFINLLGLYVQRSSEDDFGKILRQYQPNSDSLNANDAQTLWGYATNVILAHSRFNSELFVWEKMCDYFSDEMFQAVSNKLLPEIENWIEDSQKVVSSGTYIFKALAKITRRGNSERGLTIICKAIDHNINRFADEIHSAAKSLDYSKFTDERVEFILDRLFKQCRSDSKNSYHWLPELLLVIRLRKPSFSKKIDVVVRQSYPDYYASTYELEISSSSKAYTKHLLKYIEIAKKRNDEQGKNGAYSGYSYDANSMIEAIINRNPSILTEQIRDDVLFVAKGTLISDTQTVTAKINAIHLLESLWSLGNDGVRLAIKTELTHLLSERQSFGVLRDIFNEVTEMPYLVSKGFLQLAIIGDNAEQLAEQVLFFDRHNSNDVLLILREFKNILMRKKLKSYFEPLYSSIIQCAFEMSTQKEIEIRKAAALVLILAAKTKYREICIRRLSTLMDSGASALKVTILQGIISYVSKPYTAFKYIIQKGLVDNNYQIRNFAQKLQEKSK